LFRYSALEVGEHCTASVCGDFLARYMPIDAYRIYFVIYGDQLSRTLIACKTTKNWLSKIAPYNITNNYKFTM